MTTTWISGTHGIVAKNDVEYVFTEERGNYMHDIYAKTKTTKVLLYEKVQDEKLKAAMKHIMESLAVSKPIVHSPEYIAHLDEAIAFGKKVRAERTDKPLESLEKLHQIACDLGDKKKVKMYKYKCCFECGVDILELKSCDAFVRKHFQVDNDIISFSSPMRLDELLKLIKSLKDCHYMWHSLNYAKHFDNEFIR